MRRISWNVWSFLAIGIVAISGIGPWASLCVAASDESGGALAYRIPLVLPLQAGEAERIQSAIRRLSGEVAENTKDGAGAGPEVGPGSGTTLLLEMVPDPNAREVEWGTTSLGVAQDMADFLTGPDLAGTRVICHVKIPVLSGHAILIAMAADAITAETETEIRGPEGRVNEPVSAATCEIYREMAGRRARIPAAVAVRLANPDLELLELRTDTGTQFVLKEELEASGKNRRIDSQKVLATVGAAFRIPSTTARRYGWVERITDTRDDLCELLGVSEIRPVGAAPDAILRFRIEGKIPDHLADRIRGQLGPGLRHLENARRDVDGGDVYTTLLLDINSPGGNLAESLAVADWLLQLDPERCRTVARVCGEARSDALLVVWACRQILATPESLFGGDGLEAFRAPEDRTRVLDFLGKNLCPQVGRDPAVLTAILLPGQEIHVCRNRKTGQKRCFLKEDIAGHGGETDWKMERIFTPSENSLSIAMNVDELRECGVPISIAESNLAIRRELGDESTPIIELRHNFVTRLVDFLSSVWTTRACLTLAFLCLFVEIFILPGIGIGGFFAMVFF
ncbi:MAG: hypothetical protein Q4C47_01340, partial [Planctomycetia bacterium]|nr:hypothetical protein [Planctomycetia bacterium]